MIQLKPHHRPITDPKSGLESAAPTITDRKPFLTSGRLLAYLVILLVFLTFSQTLKNGYVWDDYYNLVENSNFRGFSLEHLQWMFTTFHDGNYHPVFWLSLALDHLLWGMKPAGYHLTNLILHMANAGLFFFLLRSILIRVPAFALYAGSTVGNWAAAVGSLFFACHPMRVESVAWISSRADLLCALFYILTIGFYLRAQNPAYKKTTWLAFSILTFILSLLSRAWGVSLPLILLILDIYPLRRFGFAKGWEICKICLLEKIPYFVLVLAVAALAIEAKQPSMKLLAEHDFLDRLGQSLYGLCYYLFRTVAPVHLSPLYLLDGRFSFSDPRYFAGVALTVGVATTLIVLRRRWPWVLAAGAAYAITISPLLGIFQSGPQLVADRYSYIAGLPFAVVVAAGALYGWLRSRLAGVAQAVGIGLTLVLLMGFSWSYTRVWKDDLSFWNRVIHCDSQNYLAYNNRGNFLKEHSNSTAALLDYDAAIRINPHFARAFYNRGVLRQDLGDLPRSLGDYDTALRIDPNLVSAHYNRGVIYHQKENYREAQRDYDFAIALKPDYFEAYGNRGLSRMATGDFAGAIEDFSEAIKISTEQWSERKMFEYFLAEAKKRSQRQPDQNSAEF